ncbi:protein sll1483-like isoform X2 [Mytilus californianus]|uniref:protein sll1483-like isoform X2 n=1 Tax=Mytilus californianus TaxID=6549 RepID=UPI002246BDED|nr:protein sll1483-like isoform X2 [Mytilus californianus]
MKAITCIIIAYFGLSSADTIPELAEKLNGLKFVKLLDDVGLTDMLSGSDGPYTLFAPTDAAFEQFPPYLLIKLVSDDKKLSDTLNYHLLKGTLYTAGLTNGMVLPTVEGRSLNITMNPDKLVVNDCKITTADISVVNGVIHVIDTVLLPPVVG